MHTLLFVSTCLLVTAQSLAQDLLVKKDGIVLTGYVKDMDLQGVAYAVAPEGEGTLERIPMSELSEIRYAQGDLEIFREDLSAEVHAAAGAARNSEVRRRITDLDIDGIHIEQKATISLINTIDEDGYIVSVMMCKSKTTTQNETLIRAIMAAVHRQIRYNRDPGSTLVKIQLDIRVFPD